MPLRLPRAFQPPHPLRLLLGNFLSRFLDIHEGSGGTDGVRRGVRVFLWGVYIGHDTMCGSDLGFKSDRGKVWHAV